MTGSTKFTTKAISQTTGFLVVVGLLVSNLVGTLAYAQDTLHETACGDAGQKIVNPVDAAVVNLRLEAQGTCFLMFVQDNYDYEDPFFSAWENTTWWATSSQDVYLEAVKPPGQAEDFTLTVRTLTFENTNMDPQGQRFEFKGDPIGLTLNNGSIDFGVAPLWQSGQSLAIHAGPGNNGISQLNGVQAPVTLLQVDSGSTLQIAESGSLGPGLPDSSRLFFTADNSADIDGGTLDIHRSHMIYRTGSNEMRVQNGGTLKISGSSETTLETDNLVVHDGILQVEAGENSVRTDSFGLNDADVVVGDSGSIYAGVVNVAGANTVTLGTTPGDKGTMLEAESGIALSGDPASITFDGGFGKVVTPMLLMDAGAPNGMVSLDGDIAMEIVAGLTNNWGNGSIMVGADAELRIGAGAVVSSSIPITNDGQTIVDGTFLPQGTHSGTGFMRVHGDGKLGPLGQNTDDTFTSGPDIFMDDNSRLEIAIDSTAGTAQRLVANNAFGLQPTVGVFLTLDIFNDIALPLDTKFEIVTYPNGNDLTGQFIQPNYSRIEDGDLIGLGMNTYRINYTDSSSFVDGANAITLTVADADTTHALFHVSKAYSDSNTTPVDVTLTCNGGLPLTQSATISPGNPVTFTLTNLPETGTVHCEVTEVGSPVGYTADFWNHDTHSATSCVFDPVHGANVYGCEITNTANNAEFTVTKIWELMDGGFEEVDYDVEINVSCNADILSVDGQPSADPSGTATFMLGDGESSTLEIDTSGGTATCSATEVITQSGVESHSDGCTNVTLSAAASEQCTFTNTVFFEGIPALDRYGLALLALMMLGVGFVGMRRFA